MPSVFSRAPADSRLAENSLAYVLEDAYPASAGHVLVVPKREVASWFEATKDEQLAILELLAEAKKQIELQRGPRGFRILINEGSAQHIRHLHVHLIPWYAEAP